MSLKTLNAFFSKLCFQDFSRTTQPILMKFYTGLRDIIYKALNEGFFLISFFFSSKFAFFYKNVCQKSNFQLFFLRPSLLPLLKYVFFIFISDDPERSSADNAEAPFFRGTAGNGVVMTAILITFFENFTKCLLNIYLLN